MSAARPDRIVDLSSSPHAYVTPRALAAHWCVSRQSIYRWIEIGVLPAKRIGPEGPLRIRRQDALRFERRYERDLFDARTAGRVRVGSVIEDEPATQGTTHGRSQFRRHDR